MKLVDVLQKIYNVNLNIPEDKFDMETYFKVIQNSEDSECKTTACLIGNAVLYDDYFKNNGLFLNSIYSIEYEDHWDIKAVSKFLEISEIFASILFIPNVSKNVIMGVLEKTINCLKENSHIKLHELLLFLKNEDELFLEATVKIIKEIDQNVSFDPNINIPLFYLQTVDEIAKYEIDDKNFIYNDESIDGMFVV